MPRDMSFTAILVKRDIFVIIQIAQEKLLSFCVLDQLTQRTICLFPYPNMYWSRQNIFIGNTNVRPRLAVFIFCIHRFYHILFYINLKHCTFFNIMYLHSILYFRYTIKLCSSFYHIHLFLRTNSRNTAIILYAYQQFSPIGIGKSRKSFSDFSCIRDFKFKILLLVLSFCYQRIYIICVPKRFHTAKVQKRVFILQKLSSHKLFIYHFSRK